MIAIAGFAEFERLKQILGQRDPAEVHGVICGTLCIIKDADDEVWLARIQDELFSSDKPSREISVLLRELFNVTVSQLNDAALRFYPLLPADQRRLSSRVASLGRWCEGFLFGLSLGGLHQRHRLPTEAQEFLRDLGDIARVSCDTEEAENEDEAAYMEIVEYIKVGVLLLHHVLGSPATKPSSLH
jgi:uncharacterized protein YgfB (UPF0149 family)